MKRLLLPLPLCFALTVCSSWAGVVGSTNPADFPDQVDWCQLGCQGAALPTPQPWTSAGGSTGLVGNANTGDDFYNLQQGSNWTGDFNSGMGLIYNGVAFGNTPTQVAATFDQAQSGVGAYIQSDFHGSFTATVSLFDINFQLLGSFTTSGTASGTPGNPLFIGATDTTDAVWAVQFEANGTGSSEPDFAIGTMGLAGNSAPEPASFLVMAPALLGLAAFLRRRGSRKSSEVE